MKGILKRTAPLVFLLLLLAGCERSGGMAAQLDRGYLDTVPYALGFLAVGTEGRMDCIEPDGRIVQMTTGTDRTLMAVDTQEDTVVAVGKGGTALLLEEDGVLSTLETGVKSDLYSVCFFNESCFIGTDRGALLKTVDLRNWERVVLPVEGAVTGLAENGERCIAVTDQGETATTLDGITWTTLDYNEYYGQLVTFHGIEACPPAFLAYGVDKTGAGRVLTTVEGGVWSDRAPLTEEELDAGVAAPTVSAICWDGQQAYVTRMDGQVLTMPSCTSCNKLQQIGDAPLLTTAHNGGKLLFAGREYNVYIEETEAVRQSRIKAPAALEKQKNGALIIDVRSTEDYAKKHIAGSIHIEVSQVESELPSLCPDRDREVIFYCKSGVRSQTALETAQALGYQNCYNLGGIDDWNYEFEP